MHPLKAPEIFHKYLKYLDNIENCSPKTLKAYEIDLRQAFPEFWGVNSGGETQFRGLRIRADELFKVSQEAQLRWGQLSLSSRNRKAATLKSFFQYLYNEKFTDLNYAEKIHCPKIPKKLPRFISLDEALALINTAKKDDSLLGKRQLALLFLLYGGGLRISEATSLTWKQVDFNSRTLRIKGKGSKERMVVLPIAAIKALSELKDSEVGPFGSASITDRTGYQWIRDLGKRAGILRILNPHSLRHSFATHMLASGAGLRTLQELLGHSSLAATEKYTHVDLRQLTQTLETHHPFSKTKT